MQQSYDIYFPRFNRAVYRNYDQFVFPDDYFRLGTFGEGLTRAEFVEWYKQFIDSYAFLRNGTMPVYAIDNEGQIVARTLYRHASPN